MADRNQTGTQERRNQQFRQWYSTHREEFNKRRRERYQADAELREKARENAKTQRGKKRRGSDVDLTPVVRMIDNEPTHVYRAAAAGSMIGRSADTIRSWAVRGLVPESDDDWVHRTYTLHQITLMKALVEVMEKYRYDPEYQERLAEVVEYIADNWNA